MAVCNDMERRPIASAGAEQEVQGTCSAPAVWLSLVIVIERKLMEFIFQDRLYTKM